MIFDVSYSAEARQDLRDIYELRMIIRKCESIYQKMVGAFITICKSRCVVNCAVKGITDIKKRQNSPMKFTD